MSKLVPQPVELDESGGFRVKITYPLGESEIVASPQQALALAREIIRIHDAIFEREKALRENESKRAASGDEA
jgi:hypothetical protein